MNAVKSKEFRKILNRVPENYYDAGVRSNFFQRFWHKRKWTTLNEILRGARGKLLDIGCADGTTTRQIKHSYHNLKVTGVDIYPKAISYAKRVSAGINFLTADAHALPFTKNTFDWVVAIEVLEHLHDSEKVLEEIRRVLKKGGYLIVGQDTDSLLFKIIWWFWTRGKGSVWVGSHINCMQPKRLTSEIKRKGFRIKKVQFINFGMEIFIVAQKI